MSRQLVAVALAFALSTTSPLQARTKYNALKEVIGCSAESVCEISYSPGGMTVAFLAAALDALERKVEIRISGECISSCTMLADKARPQVCVTPTASMHFHAGQVRTPRGAVLEYVDFEYAPDLQAWVNISGGLPEKGFIVLAGDALLKYWPLCKT